MEKLIIHVNSKSVDKLEEIKNKFFEMWNGSDKIIFFNDDIKCEVIELDTDNISDIEVDNNASKNRQNS
jgi:hypothetical protein